MSIQVVKLNTDYFFLIFILNFINSVSIHIKINNLNYKICIEIYLKYIETNYKFSSSKICYHSINVMYIIGLQLNDVLNTAIK